MNSNLGWITGLDLPRRSPDPAQYRLGELEGPAAVFPTYDGSGPPPDGLQKRRQLPPQRLGLRAVRGLRPLDLDLGQPIRTRSPEPVDLGLPGGEVDRDVGPWGEDPELADLLG